MRLWLALLPLTAACVGFHPLPSKDRSQAATEAPPAVLGARLEWQTIGTTVEGRPLRITRIGTGPRRVLWIGGIHGNEPEGRVATSELPHALAARPGALERITLTILEDLNPDGSAANVRGNANGVDLNRNYPASNFLPGPQFGQRPLDQPEAQALHELVAAERPHLVLVAHSWRGRHFVNYDGPAERFAELFAHHSGFPIERSDHLPPTPGSLGSWIGRTLGVPILTLEYLRGSDPLAAWLDTREAILAVVLSA